MLGVATTQPGFFFQRPWGEMTTAPDEWEANALPLLSVVIEETDPTTGATLRHLRTLTAATTPRILRSVSQEEYGVGWDLYNDSFDDTLAYRIRVLANETELGRSDIAPNIVPILYRFQAAQKDKWIKFRVEQTAPVAATAPIVTGTADVGELLTTSDGTWTAMPAPTSYAHAWERQPTDGGAWVAIAGATTAT
jgi:hypothetical protein